MEDRKGRQRPEPVPTPVSEGFWQAARAGRLAVQTCRRCGHRQHYPRDLCLNCWGGELDFQAVGGRGTVYAFTIVHRAPAPEFGDTPYAVGLVDLDEGVRMMGRIASPEAALVRIGAAVEVRFEDRGESRIPYFEIVP